TWFRVQSSPLVRAVHTRFRCACGCRSLRLAPTIDSLAHAPKGTPSEDCSSSDRLSAHGFRVYLTPLAGALFTFPSRYCCAIGHPVYLALEGGPPCFPPR